jgi:hypothetical protein
MLMRRILTSTFLFVIVGSLVITAAHSQTKEQKVFAPIPQRLRASLIQRLNLYIDYERTKQYEKLYDLSLESVATPKQLDREAFVKASKMGIANGHRRVLLKFKPIQIVALSIENEDLVRYHISGMSKEMDRRGRAYERQTAIEVRWISGDWYFSGLWDVIID